MPTSTARPRPTGLALLLNWPRVRFTLLVSLFFGLMLSPGWKSGPWSIFSRTLALGLVAMLVFGLLEQWPRRLPRRVARWALQVAAVALALPVATFWIYVVSTPPGAPPYWRDADRAKGAGTLMGLGVLVGPWLALGALVRQKEALARHQALELDLARSELERQALDARLRLVQAQVAPHFLFNTLANVQALVDTGSPRAAEVLRSLVAYLRAAVPRLDSGSTTVDDEIGLARAYLELMHMRMPDRLRFTLEADDAARRLRCPPLTLLTLVENAVRHGIDPSEEGGSIDIAVRREGGRCHVSVRDTGLGPGAGTPGLGTGLETLRERLALAFGGDARLELSAVTPNGTLAAIEFPAEETAP